MRAMELMDEMAQGRVERDTTTYSTAVSACEKGGQCLWAMELMDEMAQGRVERNTVSACEKGGQWLGAMLLMEEMAQGRAERKPRGRFLWKTASCTPVATSQHIMFSCSRVFQHDAKQELRRKHNSVHHGGAPHECVLGVCVRHSMSVRVLAQFPIAFRYGSKTGFATRVSGWPAHLGQSH